jgi:hypothetical protein
MGLIHRKKKRKPFKMSKIIQKMIILNEMKTILNIVFVTKIKS